MKQTKANLFAFLLVIGATLFSCEDTSEEISLTDEKSDVSYGHTEFSDLTDEEIEGSSN